MDTAHTSISFPKRKERPRLTPAAANTGSPVPPLSLRKTVELPINGYLQIVKSRSSGSKYENESSPETREKEKISLLGGYAPRGGWLCHHGKSFDDRSAIRSIQHMVFAARGSARHCANR
jgi:hypothetical protein